MIIGFVLPMQLGKDVNIACCLPYRPVISSFSEAQAGYRNGVQRVTDNGTLCHLSDKDESMGLGL